MTAYCIVMEQAITVADLGNDTLVTGQGGSGDAVQSCSVIIMFNTVTHAAGLYHYPAGDITRRPKAQLLIKAMAKAVKPDLCCVAYGVAAGSEGMDMVLGGGSTVRTTPSDPFSTALKDHLFSLVPDCGKFKRMPANTGVVTFSQNQGAPVYGNQTINCTDLSGAGAGNHGQYAIYWAHDKAKKK